MTGATWLDGQERLQRGILSDTYRFLKPRIKRNAPVREYSGLELNVSLCSVLREKSFDTGSAIVDCDGETTVILPKDAQPLGIPGVNSVSTTDENGWYHPRRTNADMQLNQSARVIAELIDQGKTSPHEDRHQPNHAA